MTKAEKKCENCGTDVIGREGKKFCSYKCRYTHASKNQYQKKPKKEIECQFCGIKFIAIKITTKTCNDSKCRAKHRSLQQKQYFTRKNTLTKMPNVFFEKGMTIEDVRKKAIDWE